MITGDSGGSAIGDLSGRLTGSGAILAIGATILTAAPDPAGAAPFDFLFGGPPPPSRVARVRRRPAARPPMAAIPLPPPRPHFPGDPPEVATEAETSPGKDQAQAKSPEVAPPQPTQAVSAAATSTPPLPPQKPADIQAPQPSAGPPATPQGGAETAKPAEPKSFEPGKPAAQAPAAALPAQPPTPPPKPAEVAKPEPSKPEPAKPEVAKPEVAKPATVAPSGATTAFTPRSPADNPQCPGALAVRHVDAPPTVIGPQPDARCTVVEPVRLAGMTLADGSSVAFPDHPTIACTTADTFTAYVRDLLVPLAKGTFGAPVTEVWTGPGLECRSRDSIFGAKLSAHGQGLAIDIAQLKLADGRLIEVGTPKTDTETGFETAARAGACGYFHTVLGPGSDAYHRTHWHFDLEVRGAHGDSKYCK